ncbi:LLM class flavin-dependent oxidoreductase [Ornithinimicrobium sediminis]|uniref:LLM class flavin-dependent oxidoreductase n=1 Tax=Ornithinimicrobium sediminis TaxID=2904603 RepID=UPI001E3EE432|nr:LLM class flavin-dependent oxidoreductase [Ornithinimicrobium sediminis]MCE0487242.1 LLM class flavin-dependent oxidoreductase [Ornithinimicrobium sediminis]
MAPTHAAPIASPVPRHGLILPNPVVGEDAALMVEYAVAAEESGWDGVFLWDVLIWPSASDALGAAGDPEHFRPDRYEPQVDPIITLAGIATRTERVTLGTWIVPAARRQPWQLARDLATLDRLSHGRVLLGVGLGRRAEYDLFGEEWDARRVARRYDEVLELLSLFWSGERVTFHGEFYDVDDVALLPTPTQRPRIPILVAAFWPNKKPVRRAARWDGLMPVVDPDPEGQDLTDLVTYYGGLPGEPGEVFLYVDASATTAQRVARYRELGVTWLASDVVSPRCSPAENLEAIRKGPPPW